MDKLHDLYDRLVDARREMGEEGIPFHKFAELVKGQVSRCAGVASTKWRSALPSRTGA